MKVVQFHLLYLFNTQKTIYSRNYYISVVNSCKKIYWQITMINTWGIKRCGHCRNLNVCISVGGAWTFTNSIVTCFMSHTVKQIIIMEPGQISFKDGVQVSRTLIGDPILTNNNAPHNLSRFWAQQSLNCSFYHHTCLQTLLKERNWPDQLTLFFNVHKISRWTFSKYSYAIVVLNFFEEY